MPTLDALLISVNHCRAESSVWGRVMPLYVVSCDEQSLRNAAEFNELMFKWQARRLIQSVWLVELAGSAEAVNAILVATLGARVAVAVLELSHKSDWSVSHALDGGIEWLETHVAAKQ